ncbi:hypothetical protein predicted by Glimmer/Critica [Sorangium cellulosum So ce56]|uniref:Secreted protein n=1 Tax=Sorangium cellulosum (strain So ce56) TaxID=448385 RepID=A9FW28_SORC5|nr:hypothetical protein predicted by Glimmer/Critica [Sorangium cellulosum So ce56]
MMNLRTLAASGALGLMSFAVACGPVGDPAVDDLESAPVAHGLSIVDMDEAAGKLVLKFEKDGRTITYDMRLGPKMETPPTPEELAANPELPTYQIDAQVLDANGQPFRMQMGGDAFIDASWAMPRVEGFDEAGRLADIRLMRDAVPAFRALELPEGLAELRLAGIEIGLGVDGLSEKPGAEIPANEAPVIGGGALAPQGLEFGGSAVVNWDYQIRNKAVALGLGDHTAVLLRGWSSSTNVVFTAASCNHGACAGASSMNTHCTMSGFRTDDGTHTRYFYSEPSGSTSQVSGGCSTEYAWDSGNNQHNCNDDAELQRDAIYNDSWQSTTAGPCSTRGFHNRSPGCH